MPRKQTSEVSETFKFTLVAQGKTQEMVLEIDEHAAPRAAWRKSSGAPNLARR